MNDFCWPKAKRIRNRRCYQQVQNVGSKYKTSHFIFFYIRSNRTQIGLTVTKRIGNAVYRNKIKRFLREYFRHYYNDIPAFQIVVVVRHTCISFNKEAMISSLNRFQKYIIDNQQKF